MHGMNMGIREDELKNLLAKIKKCVYCRVKLKRYTHGKKK